MSAAATVNQYEWQAIEMTRDFLVSLLPSTTEVVRGQDNRVPEPLADDFVVVTPLTRTRLATTTTFSTPNSTGSTRTDVQSTRLTLQLDFHGPNSGNALQIFTTLFRSDYACDFYAQDLVDTETGTTSILDVTPLDHSDPRQMPFINAEGQYEERWSIDAELQVNPVVTTQTQSAIAVTVGIIEIDATYKP